MVAISCDFAGTSVSKVHRKLIRYNLPHLEIHPQICFMWISKFSPEQIFIDELIEAFLLERVAIIIHQQDISEID